jgi:hypothetical protein
MIFLLGRNATVLEIDLRAPTIPMDQVYGAYFPAKDISFWTRSKSKMSAF